jgi:hypothetical protein
MELQWEHLIALGVVALICWLIKCQGDTYNRGRDAGRLERKNDDQH